MANLSWAAPQKLEKKQLIKVQIFMTKYTQLFKQQVIEFYLQQTFCKFERTIHEYVHYYNHEWIRVKLKGLSLVEYRTQSLN